MTAGDGWTFKQWYDKNKDTLIETIEILSDPETMRDIAKALEEYEQGIGIEFNQLCLFMVGI